jgi:hypothetical protein
MTNLVASYTHGTLRNNFTGFVGMVFTPTAAMTVTALGALVQSGNTGSIVVSLAIGGTVLASVSISVTGATPGSFAYVSISPIGLTAGSQYYLAATVTSGGNQWSDTSPVALNDAGSVSSAFSSSLSSPGLLTANQSYYGVDLVFTVGGLPQIQASKLVTFNVLEQTDERASKFVSFNVLQQTDIRVTKLVSFVVLAPVVAHSGMTFMGSGMI